jgi:hypothetical protein
MQSITLGDVTVSCSNFGPQHPCLRGEEHMIVIGKGSMIRPDALTPHIIDDEMRVVGELKAEGVVTSAYRRSDGPGFYLLAEGPSIDSSENESTPPCPSSRTSRRSNTTQSTKSKPAHGNCGFARKVITQGKAPHSRT